MDERLREAHRSDHAVRSHHGELHSGPAAGRQTLTEDLAPRVGSPYRHKSLFDTKPRQAEGPEGDGEGDAEVIVTRVKTEPLGPGDGDVFPIGPRHNLEAAPADFAAVKLPELTQPHAKADGAPEREPHPPAGGPAPTPHPPVDDTPVSPAIAASIAQMKADASEGATQAEADSNAFKADLQARRDQFDAEQEAIILEQLKAMSPEEKRATLVEFGYDEAAAARIPDGELDALIEGVYQTQARQARINGMTPEELAQLTPAQKIQHLVDMGIDRDDLEKIGERKACGAFDEVMAVAHTPGTHKVKVTISNNFFRKKSWEVTIKVDDQGTPEFSVKQRRGFFSRLWGWVKALIPIILTVLGPITGGVSLIILAVYQTMIAIKTGDWLGAIIGIAGAFIGIGALASIQSGIAACAATFTKIAGIAEKVRAIALAAQSAMAAIQSRSPGSLLAAIATGAGAFAAFAANAASRFAQTMVRWQQRLDHWAQVIGGAERVYDGIRNHDPLAALTGALDTAAAAVGTESRTGQNLTRAASITRYINAGRAALATDPPNYGALAEAALGIAAELKRDRRFEDAKRIVGAANHLRAAWAQRNSHPEGLLQAALELAEAIQIARYDANHPDDGDPTTPEPERDEIMERYTRATNIVRAAAALVRAILTKPRPDYLAALDAATQLAAELTDSGKIDAAAVITSRLNAWTAAVRSKDEAAILAAALALGDAIDSMHQMIEDERRRAREAAQAEQPPNQPLPTDDGGDLPYAGEPPATTTTPPAGNTPTPPPRHTPGPRAHTPDANYTVVKGDTLSGLANRFDTTVAILHERNPQIVDNRIYIGQRLYVPGAEHAPPPRNEPEPPPPQQPEAPAPDPAQAEHDSAVRECKRDIATWRQGTRMWLATNSLGWDFYPRVRDFDGQVAELERMLTQPQWSASTLRYEHDVQARHFDELTRLFKERVDQNDLVGRIAVFALEIVRDGCGAVLTVVDRSRIISAGYQTVITAIDEYSKGGTPDSIALRSAIAGILEGIPSSWFGNTLKEGLHEAMRSTAVAINDYMAEVSRKEMNAEQKRKLQLQLLARVGNYTVGAATFDKLVAWGLGSKWPTLSLHVKKALSECFEIATDRTIDS